MNSHRRQEPVLIVRLFGGLDVKQHSAPLRSLNSPRLQAFFAYLILHRQAPQSRQHIAFLFWPNSDERQAMANLRKLLHQLRQALPEADHFIDADAATIRWRPEASFTLNIAEFETALAGADAAEAAGEWQATRDALQKAVALYQGDLLPGNYDAWLASRREALYQSYLSALERLSQLLEHRGEYQEATTVTRRLLQREPLRELYYRRLMRLHALRGDRAGALAVYRECATRLQRELNVDPGPATQKLRERLLDADSAGRRPQSAGRGRSARRQAESKRGRCSHAATTNAVRKHEPGGDRGHFTQVRAIKGSSKDRLHNILNRIKRSNLDE